MAGIILKVNYGLVHFLLEEFKAPINIQDVEEDYYLPRTDDAGSGEYVISESSEDTLYNNISKILKTDGQEKFNNEIFLLYPFTFLKDVPLS